MKPTIILASSSLIRKRVLDRIGLSYEIKPSTFEEDMTIGKNEKPHALAIRLALGKAQDVAKNKKNAIIIGADTFAITDRNELLGKPHSNKRAKEFLQKLSGKKHLFVTGIALIDTITQKTLTDFSSATAHMKQLSDKQIENYIQLEDVTNAGGAYKMETLGSTLVNRVEGDYYAIIGISPSKLYDMFARLGYNFYDFIQKK